MSQHAFDALIARQSPLDDAARVAVIIASDFRFAYFGTAAAAAIIRNGMPWSGVAACCLVNRGRAPRQPGSQLKVLTARLS
jgi:hypothetical protein